MLLHHACPEAHFLAADIREDAVAVCRENYAANKIRGVRCALCSDCFSAEMTRRHNDSNVLALGGRVLGAELAKRIMKLFLTTPFEGGRHQRRVDQMMALEAQD